MWKSQKSARLIDRRIIDRPTLNYAAQNLAISVFNSMCLCAWRCVANLWTRRALWAAARANDCAAGTFVWPCEENPPLFMFDRDVCGNTDVFSVNFFNWIRATFLHANLVLDLFLGSMYESELHSYCFHPAGAAHLQSGQKARAILLYLSSRLRFISTPARGQGQNFAGSSAEQHVRW